MKTPPILFYILAASAITIFLVMNLGTVPAIMDQAGGHQIFDNLPWGYDLKYATDFITALTPEGRAMYLGVQKHLDTLFPVLMAASLTWGLWILTARLPKLARGLLCAPAILGPLFDLCENAAVRVMLYSTAGPEGPAALTPSMVALASTFSRIKWTLDLIAVAAFLLLLWSIWLKRHAKTGSAT